MDVEKEKKSGCLSWEPLEAHRAKVVTLGIGLGVLLGEICLNGDVACNCI